MATELEGNEQLQKFIALLSDLNHECAETFASGKIEILHKMNGFRERLTALYEKTEEGKATFCDGDSVRAFWTEKRKELHVWVTHTSKSFKTDKANLIRYGGFDEQTASDYAYMISEAANWCNFRDMLRLDGRTSPEKIAEVISCINSTVTVDTSPKVTLKAKD